MQLVRATGNSFAACSCAHAARSESRGIVRFAILLGLALATVAGAAFAEEPRDTAKEAYWQNRYRNLIAEAQRLREEIAHERELYADANRRNYRRGSKRHVHRRAGEEAARALAEVEAKLATIEDEARRAGAGRGWIHQVEMELEDEARRPAVAAGPGDEGRNPLHLKSRDDEPQRGSKLESDSAERNEGRNEGRNPLHLK